MLTSVCVVQHIHFILAGSIQRLECGWTDPRSPYYLMAFLSREWAQKARRYSVLLLLLLLLLLSFLLLLYHCCHVYVFLVPDFFISFCVWYGGWVARRITKLLPKQNTRHAAVAVVTCSMSDLPSMLSDRL